MKKEHRKQTMNMILICGALVVFPFTSIIQHCPQIIKAGKEIIKSLLNI